ncbi:MAG: protein phosphatase 2C domain-containing protein, partial [Oscillospiraceae bacterium]
MIKVFGSTDCGNVRKQNQDSFIYDIIDDNTAYAVVCDGMGGEKAGDIASTMACKILEQHLSRSIRAGLSEITVRNIIQTALQDANLQIYQKSVSEESCTGMGTTVVMVVVMGSKVYFSSIGDS